MRFSRFSILRRLKAPLSAAALWPVSDVYIPERSFPPVGSAFSCCDDAGHAELGFGSCNANHSDNDPGNFRPSISPSCLAASAIPFTNEAALLVD